MLRNAVKKLTKNLGLKILAFIFAFAMWMAVVNLDDPAISRTFTIAVTIENESAITNMDKCYEIDNDEMNVTFNVTGKRSVVDDLGSSDFKATADLAQLIQGDDANFVPVEITALTHASQLTIAKRTRRISVSLEDLRRETFGIQASAQGSPAEGYALGGLEVTPNRLRVSGPKTVVSQIDTVKAYIDVSGMSTGVTDSVVPILMDKKGEVIDTTKLTLNLSSVTVKADIVLEKTVPIRVSYSGKPAEGYEVISVKTEPEKVKIKGKSDVLNAISAISIPERVVNVSGADDAFEQRVDLNQYLPDGVSLSNSAEASIVVKVDVEQLERRAYTVPVSNIGVDHMPEGYRIEFNVRNVEVAVYGLQADLDSLTVNAIRPVLDVEGLAPGRHVGGLQIKLGSEYVVGDTTISFTIYSDNDDDTQADDDTQTDDDTKADDQTPQEDTGTDDDDTGSGRRNRTGSLDGSDAERTDENVDDLEDD